MLHLALRLFLVFLVFAVSQSFISDARVQVFERTGTFDQANYIDRAEIILDVLGAELASAGSSDEDRRQGWWTRLSYANVQAEAIRLREQGYRHSSIDEVWMYFVPRAVWPDKPILGQHGLVFYRLVTGREDAQSFLGLSIYGDLYWQYGWAGVVIGGSLIGWLFAMLASRSISAMRRREFILLPFVLLALNMAILGPTGFVTSAIIGPLPMLIAYYVSARLIVRAIRGRAGSSLTEAQSGA